MSAHAIGSATISFGLVSVPIKLFSAGEPTAAVSFNWLHKTDGSRLKQQYFCPKDGEVVDKDGMIKGYEFSKGQYVQFTAEELKALDERGTGAIDVKEFLPAEQVDRIFLEKTYFLGPDKGGERAYRLLAEALKKTGRVAIGQYAARGKGYLIMIRPIGGRLAMEQLRYADELRSIEEVPVGEVEIKPAELALAVQFLDQAASDQFRPDLLHLAGPARQVLTGVALVPQAKVAEVRRADERRVTVLGVGDAQRRVPGAQHVVDVVREPALMAELPGGADRLGHEPQHFAEPVGVLLEIGRELKQERPELRPQLRRRIGEVAERLLDLLEPRVVRDALRHLEHEREAIGRGLHPLPDRLRVRHPIGRVIDADRGEPLGVVAQPLVGRQLLRVEGALPLVEVVAGGTDVESHVA